MNSSVNFSRYRTIPRTDAELQLCRLFRNKISAKPWRIAFILITAASIVVAPFVWLGVPVGHDFYFHLSSWREVARQWHEGIWYPRWAEGAQYGFGEPRFIFYPPASWILGAALSLILPWNMVPGAFVWLAVVLAGAFMYWFAREYLTPHEATLAAVMYAANPYSLVTIYKRSSYAELLAAAILPLIILFAVRLERKGSKAVLPLALTFACVWLTDPPAAVIASYSLALILVTLAWVNKRPTIILWGAAAIALGFGLAVFYVGPAAVEQKWVNIADALRPYLWPINNFLLRPRQTPYASLNLHISFLAVGEIILALGSAFVLFAQPVTRWRGVWWMLIALLFASIVLMLPVSTIAWLYLPKLEFVQLPWRWLLMLNLVLSALLTPALTRLKWGRGAWLLIGFGLGTVLLLIAVRVDKMPSIPQEIESAFAKGTGYLGTVEYVPRGYQRKLFRPNTSNVVVSAATVSPDLTGSNPVYIQIEHWGTETKAIRVEATTPAVLRLSLANYPAWIVKVNGNVVQGRTIENFGGIIVQVPEGHSEIEVEFVRTADRAIAGAISAMTAILFTLWLLVEACALRKPIPAYSYKMISSVD